MGTNQTKQHTHHHIHTTTNAHNTTRHHTPHTTHHQLPPVTVLGSNLAKTGCVLTTLYMQACDSSTTCTGPSLLVVTSPPPSPPQPPPPSPSPTPWWPRTAIAAIGNLMFRKPS